MLSLFSEAMNFGSLFVCREGPMEQGLQTDAREHFHCEQKPVLNSHDSSEECSLNHWLEVYWLVEEEYWFAKVADSEVLEENPNGLS
jgi:hypothetical protein